MVGKMRESTLDDWISHAWEAGYAAYGRFIQVENPFPPGNKIHESWNKGWEAGQRDFESRRYI